MEYRVPPGIEAIEKLQNFIEVNRLKANTRIPSERDLCEMWGISRSTFRQAVDTLVEYGELYRIKGAGVYVAMPKIVRNMSGVDSMLTEMRQQGITTSKKIISIRVVIATKQISKRLKIPLGREVYECIRLREVKHVPSLMETTYLDCEQYPDFDKYYTNNTPMGTVLQNIYHRKQARGEEHISITYASEDEASLLGVELKAPLFFASGVTVDNEGIPIMYYKQIFRSDRFKFVSMIEK